MKVLLINQAFVPFGEPGHTRHQELGIYLSERGHQLTIVASSLNYQTGERTVRQSRLVVEQDVNGLRVLRAYVIPSLHRSFVWRIVAFLSFMVTSIYAALRVKDVDLVLGTSPPIFQAVSAWLIAVVRRVPFLLEIRDLWPEFAIDMGVLKNPVLVFLSRRLELFLYRRADHLVVNSPAYVDYLRARGVPQDKISFIPYGTDIAMFSPSIDGNPLRRELGVANKFVVVYAGAIGMANDLQTLLRAAKQLAGEADVQFVLFGDGKERANIEQLIRDWNLTNVLYAGVRPKSEIPQVLAASDVCLAILKDIPMFRTTYPNKVFDYMAAGRPTLLAIDGVIRRVIEDSDGGVFVAPGDDVALADAVRKLSRDRDRVRAMGAAARAYVCKHFDRQQRLEEFLALLVKLTRQKTL